ncbi:MAG: TPR protein [archaeon GW2011_AR19]|nr:MAG: TPR protein [archaeon GW2011_AR19]
MKSNWKNYLATGAFLAGSFFGHSQNISKTENKTSFVDSIMTEAKKYPTTTHFIYEIMKENDSNFHNADTLEKIIQNVEKQHEKKEKYSKEETIEILKTTSKEIENLGFEYELNKFDCDDMSFIYLAIGEKFNLHLYCVSAPEHMFIRHDLDGKHNSLDSNDSVNKGDFNWETIRGEIAKDDEYYRGRDCILKRVYLKNLTKQELIAQAFSNVGQYLCKEGDYNRSIKNYKKSIELNKNNPESYVNIGFSFFKKEEYDSAIVNYNVAIKLDTDNFQAYSNRIYAYKCLGKIEKANKDYKKFNEMFKKVYISKME